VFVETSSQFIRPLGLACMCVPYCCTEYASSGVSSATHTFQGRLEEAGCPYHMSTGNYRHWTPQMSAGFLVPGWQHRLALG